MRLCLPPLTKFPFLHSLSFLVDKYFQAGPQHVRVGPSQLQGQGGALDTRDLRHQHPRHQEDRPAGGDRHHQGPGRQGAVQISVFRYQLYQKLLPRVS